MPMRRNAQNSRIWRLRNARQGGTNLYQNGGSGASYRIKVHPFCDGLARGYAPESIGTGPMTTVTQEDRRSGKSEAELSDDLPGVAYFGGCAGAAAAEPPGELVERAKRGCRLK